MYSQNFNEMSENKQHRSISEIAAEIKKVWKNVYFGAVPYLDAMMSLNDIEDLLLEISSLKKKKLELHKEIECLKSKIINLENKLIIEKSLK